MAISSFSGKEIKKGYGKMYVKDNGSILWFASSKEEKNFLKLKRDPRKLKWTTFYKKGEAQVEKDNSKKTTTKK